MHNTSLNIKTIVPAELPPLVTAIERAMREAERITREAADEHLRAFTAQMREKFGADEIALDEPYLPKTIAYSSLKFLIQLQRLMGKIERGAGDGDFRPSIFDFDEPLMPQLNARLELETVRHQLAAKQELDKTRQQSFGIKKYIWRADGESCPICAPLDGQIFTWGDGPEPGSIHPNCQCSAEPIPDGSDINDPPIEPVYPLESLLAILVGASAAWKIGREILRRTEKDTQEPPWKLGEHKSPEKWANRLEKGNWTPKQISETLAKGEKFPAPNNVRPENPAMRYQLGERFVVRDEITGEILQVSAPGYIPKTLP